MISRRNFIQTSAVAITGICLRPRSPVEAENAQIRIVDKEEPGQPIVVSGYVYDEDGKTPLKNATLYLYHTDAQGYYSRPESDPRKSRIRAWVRVRADGSHSFQTIWPGHYTVPNPPPAHIHVHLSAPGVPDHWIDSFLFADDRHLTQAQVTQNESLGPFSAIMKTVKRTGGVVHFVRDIRLDRQLAERNKLVNGWYRNQ